MTGVAAGDRASAAAIFDLNGTLVDDIAFHFRAWGELFTRLGIAHDDALLQSFNGLKNEDILPFVLGRPVPKDELDALANEKEERYRALYRPHLAPLRGAEELMDRLREARVKLAVASSAPYENRAMVLEGLGWTSRVDAVVANEGLRGKPAPDIFLAAAEKLGVDPRRCVAFEDATNGVRAAVAAEMVVVGVTTNVAAEALRGAGARFTISDFSVLPAEIEALLFDA